LDQYLRVTPTIELAIAYHAFRFAVMARPADLRLFYSLSPPSGNGVTGSSIDRVVA
jgi:hypothetical protein